MHLAQLMPLPLTVSCFSKIQIGFTFLVPACPGSPGRRAMKRVSGPGGWTNGHRPCPLRRASTTMTTRTSTTLTTSTTPQLPLNQQHPPHLDRCTASPQTIRRRRRHLSGTRIVEHRRRRRLRHGGGPPGAGRDSAAAMRTARSHGGGVMGVTTGVITGRVTGAVDTGPGRRRRRRRRHAVGEDVTRSTANTVDDERREEPEDDTTTRRRSDRRHIDVYSRSFHFLTTIRDRQYFWSCAD